MHADDVVRVVVRHEDVLVTGCGPPGIAQSASRSGLTPGAALVFAASGARLFVVCVLACVVPARRADA